MSAVVKRLRNNSSIRAVAVSAYRAAARAMVFYPGPRVLANSMPKAGTHLLSALLSALPKMMFSGIHRALNDFSISPGIAPSEIPDIDLARVRKTLASVHRGQFMTAHFPAHSDLDRLLDDLGFRTVLILRDPRDVAVSNAFYVTGSDRHFLNRRFVEQYRTPDERLAASIAGFPDDDYGPAQESVGERLTKYVPWLGKPGVHVCRFEDLVGPRGGGDAGVQLREIRAIARHLGRDPSDDRLTEIGSRIWSPAAATFRSGTVGDWRNHFTPEHVRAFKKVAGEQLIALGYERDLDW